MAKSIEINYKSENGYEVLYPSTTQEQIFNLSDDLDSIRNNIISIENEGLKTDSGTYIGTGTADNGVITNLSQILFVILRRQGSIDFYEGKYTYWWFCANSYSVIYKGHVLLSIQQNRFYPRNVDYYDYTQPGTQYNSYLNESSHTYYWFAIGT